MSKPTTFLEDVGFEDDRRSLKMADTDIMAGLTAVDEAMRKTYPGPAGSGLFVLLDQLAVANHGAARAVIPPAAPPEEPPGRQAPGAGGPVPADDRPGYVPADRERQREADKPFEPWRGP
jgi:hypothetical protein